MTFKSISFFSVAALSACLGLTACNAGDASTKADAAPANTDYIKTSKPGAKPAPAAKSVVRVDLDRIERLVNLVGELVKQLHPVH